MISFWEYVVIIVYLVFLVVIGFVFKRLNSNVDDYFRSGSKGCWWLVGASNYISGISAYSFTGAADIAYNAGWSVVVIYSCTPLTGILTYFFFAARFRQLRLTTSGQAYGERFNPFTQQFCAIVGVVNGVLAIGMGLYSLAIFASTIFNLNIILIIVVLSAVVITYSLVGGKWAVMASDLLQSLVLISVAILVTVLCLQKVGGISGLFDLIEAKGLTEEFQMIKDTDKYNGLYTMRWVMASLCWNFIMYNSLSSAGRYFSAKDGATAKKAVLVLMVMCLTGAVFFFIPPIVGRLLYSEAIMAVPLKNPGSASYAIVCMKLLPQGMLGLVVVAMLAAAMSSMDSGLNGGSANFIKNLYPYLASSLKWKKRSPHQMLRLSQIFCLVLGVVGTLVAIHYAITGKNQYGLILKIGALITMPIIIPMFWGMFIKHTTEYSAAISILCGFLVSLTAYISESYFGWTWEWVTQLTAVVITGSLTFFATIPFARYNKPEYNRRVEGFFKRMNTPVDFEKEIGEGNDTLQLKIIGMLALIGGLMICLLAFIATTSLGVVGPLSVGGGIALVGGIMLIAAKIMNKKETAKE